MFGRAGVLSLAQPALTLAAHSFTPEDKYTFPEVQCNVDINAALRIFYLYSVHKSWRPVQGKLFWKNTGQSDAHRHYSMLTKEDGPIIFPALERIERIRFSEEVNASMEVDEPGVGGASWERDLQRGTDTTRALTGRFS